MSQLPKTLLEIMRHFKLLTDTDISYLRHIFLVQIY